MVSGETDCNVLADMQVDLHKYLAGASCDARYCVLAAVQAHEDVHKEHIKKAIEDAFATFKSVVEGITVENNDCSPASGVQSVKDSEKYKSAVLQMANNIVNALAPDGLPGHGSGSEYTDAEHQVIDPLIEQIRARARALHCPWAN